jgi:hypothetical protein
MRKSCEPYSWVGSLRAQVEMRVLGSYTSDKETGERRLERAPWFSLVVQLFEKMILARNWTYHIDSNVGMPYFVDVNKKSDRFRLYWEAHKSRRLSQKLDEKTLINQSLWDPQCSNHISVEGLIEDVLLLRLEDMLQRSNSFSYGSPNVIHSMGTLKTKFWLLGRYSDVWLNYPLSTAMEYLICSGKSSKKPKFRRTQSSAFHSILHPAYIISNCLMLAIRHVRLRSHLIPFMSLVIYPCLQFICEVLGHMRLRRISRI